MNKYIEKIAENKDSHYSPKAGIGLIGGALGLQIASPLGLRAIGEYKGKTIKPMDVKNMRRDYGLDKKTVMTVSSNGTKHNFHGHKSELDKTIGTLHAELGQQIGPHATGRSVANYSAIFGKDIKGDKDIVSLPKNKISGIKFRNPTYAMHEFGHIVEDRKSHKLTKRLERASTHYEQNVGILGSVATGIAMGQSDKTAKFAPLAAIIPHLPRFNQELKANFYAAKSLHKHKGIGMAARYLAATAPALGTYTGSLAAKAGAAGVVSSLVNKAKHQNED